MAEEYVSNRLAANVEKELPATENVSNSFAARVEKDLVAEENVSNRSVRQAIRWLAVNASS